MTQPENTQQQISPEVTAALIKSADISVLLVGNMEPEISNMKDFLQRNIVPSYRVYQCRDALEAANFLKQKKVDTILLDFGLTEKDDAQDMFSIIRHGARNTPIIIFTGEAEIDLALLILNEGATDNVVREKYTASPKSLKDAIELSLIKKKVLTTPAPADLSDSDEKNMAELAQITAKLENVRKKTTAELEKVEEKAAAELKQIQEKGAGELKELYARKLADIEYHKKILSWMNEGSPDKSAETTQQSKN